MGILFVFVAALIILVLVLRILSIRDAKYFESQGVLYMGNTVYTMIYGIFTGQTLRENLHNQYKFMKSKNAKVAGTKDFGQHTIMVTDTEMLKNILVKDFDHFVDRRTFAFSKNDVLFQRMLFAMNGDKWKSLRSKMSPTFTTGKIRRMFHIFDQSGKKLVKYVEQEMERSGQIDLTEGYSKYTMDVIASAVFGIDSKAFDQVEPSVFENMGKKLQLQFGGFAIVKFIMMIVLPKLSDALGFSFFGADVQDFFSKAIKSAIKHRETSGEIRDDFVQIMLEARAGQLKAEESELSEFEKKAKVIVKEDEGSSNKVVLDDDCIVANCVLFVVGGFDTTQSLLIFAAYALALNHDVQQRLLEEIHATLKDNDGEFTYEAVNRMEYLDAVINETLRLYPPAVATDRGCTEDYKVPNSDFVIKKGNSVIVPIHGLHYDEKYYANPEKFDPERFSHENRSKINPYAFLPFGQGPRNCIGMRFALTEVKFAIANLVLNFSIQPSEKTLIPMKYDNTNSLKPTGGMWLALNRR